MHKSFFFASLLCLICQLSLAQYPKEFPNDNTGFGKAYAELLKTCTRDDCKEISDKFPTIITSGKASIYFFKIKGISQSMLLKKASAYPIFLQFASLLTTLDVTKVNATSIDKNFDILQLLIDKSKQGNLKEFTTYLNYLTNLYTQNAVYYTNTNAWKATGDFSVDLMDDKPVYSFSKTDLIGMSTVDTLTIKDASGKYYPLENLWVGSKGSISLQRNGFDAINNFVNFGNHQIDFSKSDINIDSANFTFKPVLSKPILGVYTDKLLQAKSQERLYPKFRSYSNDIDFNTLGKEVKFSGGFQLESTNIYGVGSDTALAKLSLSGRDGKELVRVSANRIQIKDFKDINIEDASLMIFLEDNTISHPYVNFTYTSKTKDVKVYRDVKPLSKQPFTSEYHKMFLYIDELKWNLDSTVIKFSMITLSGDRPAIIESFNYYQPNLENKYKGTFEQGPIDKIYRTIEGGSSRYVDAVALALDINPGAPFIATQPVFFRLMEDGYISYDPKLKNIEVKDKLINQALAARGKQDYDFIKFASFKRVLNAKMDIRTNILEIYGVEEINMSTKSGVKFIPINDTVRIGKNRVMTLGGKIQVGKFDFVAKQVDFDYDSYSFNMKNVDSMVIYVPEGDGKPNERGEVKLIRSKTPLQNITGSLHIAAPDNKSGTNNDKKYPYFTSGDTAKVAYDKGPNGDKYNKDKFYYQVYPFELDSLGEINTENLQLDGQLISGGIFEPIKSGLQLQGDKSFGLSLETDADGFNLFGNKGKYTASLKLDGSGLTGKGFFEFGSAMLYADTTFFFLDSVYSQLDSVRILESKSFDLPQTNINQSSFIWNVPKDSLVISPGKEEKFSMYNSTIDFDGKLILNNKHLNGFGMLSLNHTKLESKDIRFNATEFEAKNCKLNLSTDDGQPLLASNDVNAIFNLEKKLADIEFNKNDTIPLQSFNYLANPKFLHFDISNNILTLNAASAGVKFFLLSTDPLKDSLKFVTAEALLNLKEKSIQFAGINELLLADSKIIPDSGQIFIDENGAVRPLKNALIIFNADSSFHTVRDAEVTIEGRNQFIGTGNYYFKMNNGTIEKVPIAEISVNNPYKGIPLTDNKKGKKPSEQRDWSKVYTIAKTSIEEDANFKLDNKIFYKGKFDFDSKHKDIFLDGSVKIEIANNTSDWIANVQLLDPKNPSVNIDSILSKANNSLFVGLMLDKSNLEFYSVILQDKHNADDAEIMNIKSSLTFSKTEENTVVFGDENAFRTQYARTSCLKYNETTKGMQAVGEIGMGFNMGPCKVTTVGSFSFRPDQQKLEINADLAIKFFMQPAIASIIMNQFSSAAAIADFSSYKRNKVIQRTLSVLTKDTVESNRLIAEIYTSDNMFVPASLDYNLLITGTKFLWDSIEASFKSMEPVSLAIFGGEVVQRQYDAYIEMGYGNETDFINVYLQNKNKDWLFFKIKGDQMGIASSNVDLQNTITLFKDAERVYKEGKNKVFEFMPVDNMMRDDFVTRMEDFRWRWNTGLDSSKSIKSIIDNTIINKTEDTLPEIQQPSNPTEESPVDVSTEFKQKPKKRFSLVPESMQTPIDTLKGTEEQDVAVDSIVISTPMLDSLADSGVEVSKSSKDSIPEEIKKEEEINIPVVISSTQDSLFKSEVKVTEPAKDSIPQVENNTLIIDSSVAPVTKQDTIVTPELNSASEQSRDTLQGQKSDTSDGVQSFDPKDINSSDPKPKKSKKKTK